MEFKYGSTVDHKDVMFYISSSGGTAMFVCGGCVVAVTRPGPDDGGAYGDIVKFGLVLKPSDPRSGALDLSDYVEGELKRRGMRRGPICDGGHVFLDCLDMMNHDPSCGVQDLCGHMEVPVRDPCVAERIVAIGVSSGIIITAISDSPRERTLRVLETPAVSNAYSGFVYEVSSGVFDLMQSRVVDPSPAMTSLLEGLFDGVPCNRSALKEHDVPDRSDVVVTAARSAKVSAAVARCQPGGPTARRVLKGVLSKGGSRRVSREPGRKRTKFCPHVQVKFIPSTLNLWAPKEDHLDIPNELPRKSLMSLWVAYCTVTEALDGSEDAWEDVPHELVEARTRIQESVDAVFGKSAPPFLFPAGRRDCTAQQKFLLMQYVQCFQNMPNCYGYILDVCFAYYGGRPDAAYADHPIDRDRISDLVTETYRGCVFLGFAVEVVATTDHMSEIFLTERPKISPTTDSCMDADFLLQIAEEALGNPEICAERDLKLLKLAGTVDALYKGEGLVALAARESRGLGNSQLLCAAIDVVGAGAFDKCRRLGRLCVYSSAMIDARLKDANIPSFYD